MRKSIFSTAFLLLSSIFVLFSCTQPTGTNESDTRPFLIGSIAREDSSSNLADVFFWITDTEGNSISDISITVDGKIIPWIPASDAYELEGGISTGDNLSHTIVISGAGLNINKTVTMPRIPGATNPAATSPSEPITVPWTIAGLSDYVALIISSDDTATEEFFSSVQTGTNGSFTIPGGTLIASEDIYTYVEGFNIVNLDGVNADSSFRVIASRRIHIDTIP